MKTKSILLTGLLGVVALGTAVAEPKAGLDPAYRQAVDAYVEAAGKELAALRVQRDALVKAAPESVKERYEAFSEELAECEQLLKALKDSSPKDFDVIKARYEKQRMETTEALRRATKT